jgi:hypothetical protein
MGMLAIWTHTQRERNCIAGLQITVNDLLFVFIPLPGSWTGSAITAASNKKRM